MIRNGRQLHMGCGECLTSRFGRRAQQPMTHSGFRDWLSQKTPLESAHRVSSNPPERR